MKKRLARTLRRWAARLDPIPSKRLGTVHVEVVADTSKFEAALRDMERTARMLGR